MFKLCALKTITLCTILLIALSITTTVFANHTPAKTTQALPTSHNSTDIEQGIRSFLENLLIISQAGCTEFKLGKQPKTNLKLNPMILALAKHKQLTIHSFKNDQKNITIQLVAHPEQSFKTLGDRQIQFCYAAVKLAGFNFYKVAKDNIYQVTYDYDLIPINSAFLSAAQKMGPLHISNNKIELKKTATGFKQSSKLWDNH